MFRIFCFILGGYEGVVGTLFGGNTGGGGNEGDIEGVLEGYWRGMKN